MRAGEKQNSDSNLCERENKLPNVWKIIAYGDQINARKRQTAAVEAFGEALEVEAHWEAIAMRIELDDKS